MGKLDGLAPEKVFKYFELLSSVPHGSGNTKAISDLCVEFAKTHGLRYVQDDVNNVVIYAPASENMGNTETVILQGHLDMVCAKTYESDIDMSREPISIYRDGDFLKAQNTSLGGDNCIAVAMILALLDSPEISHPAIEAVFTIDEEVGLIGASALEGGLLSGKYLINIDSEEEGVFTCGCAGGVRVNGNVPVRREPIDYDSACSVFDIEIGGLLGGHSGCDIDKGRANANHLMGRMLFSISREIDLHLLEFEGGQFDNVITAVSRAKVAVNAADSEKFEISVRNYERAFKNELSGCDAGVYLTLICESVCTENELCENANIHEALKNDFMGTALQNIQAEKDVSSSASGISAVIPEDSRRILALVAIMPQGVREMSADLKGLVQTSLNLGVTELKNTEFCFSSLVRSSIASQKEELVLILTELTESCGGRVSLSGAYPGWKFNSKSGLLELCRKCYIELTGTEPVITATHGGLECGLFTEKVEGIECISIGPNLYDVHSVRERLSISSTERVWAFLKKVMEEWVSLV